MANNFIKIFQFFHFPKLFSNFTQSLNKFSQNCQHINSKFDRTFLKTYYLSNNSRQIFRVFFQIFLKIFISLVILLKIWWLTAHFHKFTLKYFQISPKIFHKIIQILSIVYFKISANFIQNCGRFYPKFP